MKRDIDTTVSVIVVVVFVVLILMSAFANGVMGPDEHDGYYMDTPMYCGQGRC